MLRGGAFSDEIGTLHCSVVKQDARSTQVDLDEGFYWFGAKGTDPDGRPFGSVGTGLVRVEAGDHKVRFVLAPAVAIEGRLVGEDVLRLQAGIARRGGRLLELDVGGEGLFPFRPVGADGSFAFAAVLSARTRSGSARRPSSPRVSRRGVRRSRSRRRASRSSRSRCADR
jgi:hypothetical protein